MELMFNDKVRSHLEMTEPQVAQYRTIMRKPFDGIRELRDKYRNAPESLDSLRGEIDSLMTNSSEEAIKFLEEAEKLDELVRIYVQLHSASAAASQQVASRIGLSGDDLDAFRQKKSEVRHRLMDKIGDEMEQLIRSRNEDSREQMGRLIRYAIQQQSEALEKRLSDDQRKKLKELAGEPIDGIKTWFVKRPMPGPMGGPPNRRGEGPGRKEGPRQGSADRLQPAWLRRRKKDRLA